MLRRLEIILPTFFAFLLPVFAVGCDVQGEAPKIASLQYVPNEANPGWIELSGSFAFTDEDCDVSGMTLRILGPRNFSPMTIVDTPPDTDETTGSFDFAASLPATDPGVYLFDVWVKDTGGNTSNHLRGEITVSLPDVRVQPES